MPEKFSRLNEVLQSEKALYEKLVEIAREKQGHLVQNDLDGINETVSREEELLTEISEEEKKRKEVLKEIEGEEDSFADLCQKAPEELADKLKKTREQLLLLLEELWEVNETNNRLIQDSLQFNNNLVQSLAKIRGSDTYSQEGSKEKSRSFLDKKA